MINLTLTVLRHGSADGDLLIVGPSLGTAVTPLWDGCAALLDGDVTVVGWDLPGHGRSPAHDEAFSIPDLASAVVTATRPVREEHRGRTFVAGVSLGGTVALEVALGHAAETGLDAAAVICSGAHIGSPRDWHERAELVRRAGAPVMVEPSARRWFAPGFLERDPATGTALLTSLQHADSRSYARCCEALAAFDVRDRLGTVGCRILAVAGEADNVTPVALAAEVASGTGGEAVTIPGAAHLAPAERPLEVARVLSRFLGPGPRLTGGRIDGTPPARPIWRPDMTDDPTRSATLADGFEVRRAVLGTEHVDAAEARTTDFTAAFQSLITRYAWGEIWTRPGLDRRTRSVITLTALVARGHWEELALHVRAALRNGLRREEIEEVLLQTAIYLGVPSANHAFAIAQQEIDRSHQESQP
ncbi:3-oxoadipate enol-lactonase [Intrasporangium oryzae NRRL B-24470]|uniref:3-oxoadipate enol-lactonase n=1 Tax=Intrasporangium oryzae NRRL B-24470 TaxID=1386089 RepID=W9GFQ2_9MICO|nr:3-oxoadipate enol-lactonase [Intrasporangium oryzae NRRL B-24470]